MSLKKIPIFSDPKNYQINVAINGVNLNIRFRYNDRNDTWYMSIYDRNNTLLLSGIPTLSNVISMTDVYQVLSNDLIGDFLFFDKTGKAQDVTSEDLGNQIELYFIDNLPPLAGIQA